MTADTSIRLVRHATLTVHYAGTRLLVDPMLAEKGTTPPIEDTPNDRRNPLVSLPPFDLPAVEAVLVTHLHSDHFDHPATEAVADSIPVLCHPAHAEEIEDRGFLAVRPVEETTPFGDITITRTPAQHGHGDLAEQMGPIAGFVLEAPDEPTIYIAGDTVWYPGVEAAIETHDPDVIVVNAGGARFNEGRPITMTAEDVEAVCAAAPEATVVAVHMEAINHCLETRADLAAALEGTACSGSLVIPADGDRIDLHPPAEGS